MAADANKSLMRSLGEAVGHVIRGIRTPAEPTPTPPKRVVRHEQEEEDRGDVILRRTTIEEIEYREGERAE
ncbi:MAG: hypothetical protein GY715_19465 [Planctomycetes bacterium]|nr:hypothetical protein [Planctomycetota bacterium]